MHYYPSAILIPAILTSYPYYFPTSIAILTSRYNIRRNSLLPPRIGPARLILMSAHSIEGVCSWSVGPVRSEEYTHPPNCNAVKEVGLTTGKTTKSVRNWNFSLKTYLTFFLRNKKWECFYIRYIGGTKHKQQNYVANIPYKVRVTDKNHVKVWINRKVKTKSTKANVNL